ncbi:MAG: crosslink repair DNA glycosylase YcaQ family protein [Anaerolineaceae bacterium]|nr:crosslink repair DNA glycosylase YcaQ family protein [Anaerolineaceae bacterium]
MITRSQIITMQLSSLGLLTPPPSEPSKSDVLQTIRRMGILQIDTISVVNRSPYLVVWSRLGNYDPVWLENNHADGELFEYWAHANCFIPIEDYPFFRRKMLERATHWWEISEWVKNHQEMIAFVKETIKEKGPQKSSDFPKRVGKNNGWWDWKEEKIALDLLWTKGDLMIPYRKNFQRFYDLRENVVPHFLDDLEISELTKVNEVFVEKTIRILGATRPKWIADYYRLKKKEVQDSIQTLIDKQKILLVDSEDFPEGILIHKDNLSMMDQTLNGNLKAQHTSFLSPFDPLIWDRIRTKELFDFEYSIECYLPANKRKYGYFSLPILHDGQLIGRMDSKAHRKEKILEIKSLYFESWFTPDEHFLVEFANTLRSFANWHQTPNILFPEILDDQFKIIKSSS